LIVFGFCRSINLTLYKLFLIELYYMLI